MIHASNFAIELLPNKTLMPLTEKHTEIHFGYAESDDFHCHNVDSRATERIFSDPESPDRGTSFEIDQLDCVRFYLQEDYLEFMADNSK